LAKEDKEFRQWMDRIRKGWEVHLKIVQAVFVSLFLVSFLLGFWGGCALFTIVVLAKELLPQKVVDFISINF
jgi:hypothetical protein